MALQSVIPDDITLLHKAYNLFVCAGGIVSVFLAVSFPAKIFGYKKFVQHTQYLQKDPHS